MATMAEIYNKVAHAEEFAKSTPIERAATITNNYDQMTSPEYARNTDQVLHAVEDSGNIFDPGIAAGSAFVDAVGSLPIIDTVAKPLARGIDSLHSDSYEVHQVANQAHKDVFDRRNQAQYYSDLANGKSSTTASLAKIGREAMDYFSNSNGQDILTDIGSGAGSLVGSYVLGGAIGKAVGAVYTGIRAARLATTVEGRLAGYQSALTQAQATRAQIMTKLSDAGIANTEKEALVTELGNLNKVISKASTEQQALVQQANRARSDLAAAEYQKDLYSSTSPLKNESLIGLKSNKGTLLSDEALAKNVNYSKQSVAETTDALRANKSLLDSNKTKATTIQEYLNQERKIQSAEKGINKLNKFQENGLAQIKEKAQEISPELGGLATNFAFGLSEGKEALSELDNLTLNDFKANATEQAKQEFNSLVKDNLADGMNQEKAETEALESLKSKAKFTNMFKTGLAEAALSKVFGTAKLEGLGLKKGLAGGLLRTATNTVKETGEELGQTYAENTFGNKAIQYFNRDKDTTENLGRDLAQTVVAIPGGMGTVKAVKVGSDITRAGFTAGKAISHAFTESKTAKRVTNTVKAMDTGSAEDLSNIDKATKELLTPTQEIKDNLKEGLSNLASQFEADEDTHTTLDTFAKDIDSDATLVDTTSRLSKAVDDSVATVQSTKASDEEVQQALTDIKHLYYAVQAVHKTIENSGSEKDKPFTTKVAQANTRRLLNKLEPVMDKVLPIATEQMNKYVEDKEVAKENIENYKMHLNLVKDLINSKTNEEDLAKLDSAISKLNPSYATLPITEELKNKLELAKAFREAIKQHSDNLDSISDNARSTARQAKILGGKDGGSLRDYLNTISDLLDSNDVPEKQLAKVSNQLQHFINTQAIKADYLSSALNQLEEDAKLPTEEFNKKYSNPIDLSASDKFKELEKHLGSNAQIAIDKENNFLTISGLSAHQNKVPFQFKVRLPEHGYTGTKQAIRKSGTIQQSRALLQDIIAENNEISWLAESVNKFLNKEYTVPAKAKDTHKKTTEYRQAQQVNRANKYNAVREKSLSDLNNLFGSNNIIKEESIDIDAPVKYKLKNTNAKIAVASSITNVTNPDTGITQRKVGPVIKADLQLKSSFIYSNGSRKGTPDYDTQTSINALKALQLVSEYLQTFSIADEKERLNAQKEIFDRYPKKSNGKPVLFKLANLFTPESINKAVQEAYPNNPQEQQKLLDFWVNNPKGFVILPPKAIEKNSTSGKIYNFPLATLFLNRALSDNKNMFDSASNEVQNANNTATEDASNPSETNPIDSSTNAPTAKIDTESKDSKLEPHQTELSEDVNTSQEPKKEENKSENLNDTDLLSGNISEEFHDDLLDAFDADDLLPKGTTQSVNIKDVEDIKDEQAQKQIDNNKINELVNESVQSLEEAVNALNAINNEGFKFTTSIVDSEVIDKVLQLDTSSLLVKNIDSVVDQIALDVAKHVQTHLDSYKANARSLGLYRFFNFSVNNGQVVATWRVPKEHIRSAILLGYATASTKASSISNIVKGSLEAFTGERNDNYAGVTLSDTDYTVEGSKDKLNYSNLANTFKESNNLFVSVDALGSSLVSAFKSVFPSITSDELTYLGSKGAYDILATDFLTALNLANTNTITRVTGQVQLEGNSKKFLNIMSLPPVFINSKNMKDMFPRINDLNKAIAKASRTIPDMFIGTKEEAKELTESFESKNNIKGTNAIINKAQKEANNVAKTIPHNVNNYGKLVSNIRKQDYIDALHPYENYVSEDAREAEDSIIRQISDSFDELINTRIILSKQPDSSIYYNNNYTVANRLNSEHYQSYRNSKTIREAITPELSSTPISEQILNNNPALRKLWYRALMQGIGDKVQNQQDEEIANNVNKLKELITSKLGSENIKALAQYYDITNTANLTLDQRKHLGTIYKDLAQILRDNYVVASEVALHNAVELVRYMAKPDVEFNSTIYGEADGITNGIFFSKLINAVYMAGLLGKDEKLINELVNLARVGFALGITDQGFYKNTLDSLNKEIEDPKVHPLILDSKVQDVYTTVAHLLSKELSKPIDTNKPDELDKNLLIGLLVPYLEYSSYDIQTGTVKLSRNSVKKPVTQVNYSAGENSLATSFADQIFTEINKLLGKNGKSNLGLFSSPEIVNIKKYLYSTLVHAYKTKSMSDLDIQNAVANYINKNSKIAPALKTEFINNPDIYKALKLQVALGIARRFKVNSDGVSWSDTYTKKEKNKTVTKDTLDITYEFNSKTHSVNDKYFKYNLSQFIKQYVISPLMGKIEETMGESKNDIPSLSTTVASYIMLNVHNNHLNQELTKEIQKVIPSYNSKGLDETLLYAERVLPRRTVKEVKQRIEKEYPVKLYTRSPELDGTLTPYNLFAYKTDSTNINSEYGKATKETLTNPQGQEVVHFANLSRKYVEAGVAPRPLGNISAGDAATMVSAINEVAGKHNIPFQDIFDGLNFSSNNYLNPVNPNKIINEIAITKALGTNNLKPFYKNLVKLYKKDPELVEEYYAAYREAFPNENLTDSFEQLLDDMNTETQKIDLGHRILSSGLVPFTSDQYAFAPEGYYAKQAKLKVYNPDTHSLDTYTIMDNIPVKILPEYLRIVGGVVNRKYSKTKEAYEKYEDKDKESPEFKQVLKEIREDYYTDQETLLNFLQANGVTVAISQNDLAKVKPKAKAKPKKKKVVDNLSEYFKSAKEVYKSNTAYLAGSRLSESLLDNLLANTQAAVLTTKELTKLLTNNKIKELSDEDVKLLLDIAKQLDIQPNNAATVFIGNRCFIIGNKKPKGKILNHELIHSMFKAKLSNIFNKYPSLQLTSNNGKYEFTCEESLPSEVKTFITGLQQELNRYATDLKYAENNRKVIDSYIEHFKDSESYELIDELITQVIEPTALKVSNSARIKSDLLALLKNLLKNFTLDNLKELMKYFSVNRYVRLHGLSNLVLLSNSVESVEIKNASYALKPTTEVLKKVLETKPQKFHRLTKAFSYNAPNKVTDIYEFNWLDDLYNKQITKEQAVEWALYDDIVKNKAMSDKQMLDLNKLYTHLLKSEQFKNLSDDIQKLLYGQAASDYLGNKSLTHPLANFMFLAVNSEPVKEALKNITIPKLSFGSFNYKADQITADLVAKTYNNFIKDATVSSKYDHLLAKICSDDSTFNAIMSSASDNLSNFENKANKVVNTCINTALNKVAKTVINYAPKGSSVRELAKTAGIVTSMELHDINAVDAIATGASLVNQFYKLPNAISHLVDDVTGVTSQNYEPLALFKKSKAHLDKMTNRLAKEIPLEIKNKFRNISPEQERLLITIFLRADVSSLVSSGSNVKDLIEILADNKQCYQSAIQIKESVGLNKHQWRKIEQLANYLATGKTGGRSLLQNAYAISKLTDKGTLDLSLDNAKLESLIDQAITYLTLSKMQSSDLGKLSDLCAQNYEGMKDFIDLHIAIKNRNLAKLSNKLNYHKGYLPRVYSNQVSVDIATSLEQVKELKSKGWEVVKEITPSNSYVRQGNHKLYLMRCALPGVSFSQGLIKPNRLSLFGVNESGFASNGLYKISPKNYDSSLDTDTDFNPIPVFNNKGTIIGYDLNFDQYIEQTGIRTSDNPFQLLGIWNSQDYVAQTAKGYNDTIATLAANMYQQDLKQKGTEFVNHAYLPISELIKKDRVIASAWALVPSYVKKLMASKQNCTVSDILIRKDMVDLFLGYHQASITDIWTGRTRWNPKVCNYAAKLAKTVLGEDAYKKLTSVERAISYTTSFARNTIVVRSVVVPFTNLTANILQLRMRGIPFSYISKEMVNKVSELEHYNTLSKNMLKLETKLATLKEPSSPEGKRLQSKIDSIKASIDVLSVAPLINVGELSTINDVGDDYNSSLFTGHWAEKIEEYVDKLPDSAVQLGKYIMVSKDTGLYQLMEKATIYGDFVSKSIYYDWLLKNGVDVTEATMKAMNEFVNYDMLAGRNREYLENMGVLWFYNYKLRILRTMADIALHNPVSALLAMNIAPEFIAKNNVYADSFLGKLIDGKLGGTFMNPAMLEAPITKNPIIELMSL